MKILHLCLGNYFIDHFSYQENMLTKQHKLLGYDVEVIASCQTYDADGNCRYNLQPGSYINENDIPVTRLEYKFNMPLCYKLRFFKKLKDALEKSNPDIIFIHNCQFCDIGKVTQYLNKHKNVKVFVDNHADLTNSATNIISKLVHKTIWRYCAHKIEPYAVKFYGVLPVRVEFLENIYKIPKDKCELLVMGADDELVEAAAVPQVKEKIRKKYGIDADDFLIVTGGKIDKWKTQTLLLMEAVQNIKSDKVKLIVFGSVIPELKAKVASLADGKKVQYVGWVQSQDSYQYFATADLVVFPGRHSVFWEQVTGQGIPMLVKDLPGTHHVDLGGNVRFLTEDSAEEIQREIEYLIKNPDEYNKMKNVAAAKGMKVFSYKNISERSIRDVALEG